MTELEQRLRTIVNEKEEKLLPENLKAGVTCLGVEGTFEGGAGQVKLFETEEEMQADATAEEGDLAIVYRNESQKITKDSILSDLTFPEVVTLSEAITSSSNCIYRDEDRNYMYRMVLNASSCYLMEQRLGDIARYSSVDGITYTRTTANDTGILPTPVSYYSGTWRDVYGEFIQTGGMYFEGLYQNELYNVKDYITFILTQDVEVNDDLTRTYTGTPYGKYATADIFEVASKILTEEFSNAASFSANIVLKQDKMYLITKYSSTYNQYSSLGITYDYSSGIYYLSQSSGSDYPVYSVEINLENKTYTKSTLSKAFDTYESPLYAAYDFGQDTLSVALNYNNSSKTFSIGNLSGGTSCDVSTSTSYYSKYPIVGLPSTAYYESNKYFIAPTQLTVADSSELVPNKTALGKNGLVTGDGSIYDNLNLTSKLGINYTALPDSVVTTGFVEINNEGDIDSFKDSLGVSVSELPLSLSDCEILGKFRYIFDSSNGNIKLYDDKQFLGENTFSELVGIDDYRQSNEYFDCSDNVIVIQANKSGASATALIKCTVDYSTSKPTCTWEPLHSGSAISDNYDVYNGNVYWGRQNGSNYEIYENSNLLYAFTGVTFSYATNATHVVLDNKLYITDNKNCICFDIDAHTYTTFVLDYDSNTVVNIKLVTSDRKYVVLTNTIYKAENNGLTKISDTSGYLNVGTVTYNGYKTASVIELNGKHYFFTGKGLYCEEDNTFTQITELANYRTQQIIGNTKQELIYNLKSSDTGIRVLQVSPENLSEYIINNLSHKKYILITSYEHLNM